MGRKLLKPPGGRRVLVTFVAPRPGSAVILALIALAASLCVGSGVAAATQSGPNWETGDYWAYRSTANNGTTMIWTVGQGETVAVGPNTYDAWHVWQNISSVSPGYSFTVTLHSWLTKDGLGQVKSVGTFPFVGTMTTTWTPPMPYAVFPLNPGSSWSGTSTERTTSRYGTSNTTVPWSGIVLEETSLTVPAGQFSVAKLRIPATGAPYTIYSYSEAVGWAVQIESYDSNGVLTDTMQLTAFSYSPYFLGLPPAAWAGIFVGVALTVAAVAIVIFRRHKTQGMPPQEPGSPPGETPEQPWPPKPPGQT